MFNLLFQIELQEARVLYDDGKNQERDRSNGAKTERCEKKWEFGPKIKPHLFGNEERAILRLLKALYLMLLLGAVHKIYL